MHVSRHASSPPRSPERLRSPFRPSPGPTRAPIRPRRCRSRTCPRERPRRPAQRWGTRRPTRSPTRSRPPSTLRVSSSGAAAESPAPSPEPVAAAERAGGGPERGSRTHHGLRTRAAQTAQSVRYQRACGRYHRRYRLRGRLDLPLDRDVSPRGRRPVRAEQRERQRSHRQPRGQRRGHAGEHRRGGRHRCEQRGSPVIHGARIGAGIGTQLTVHGRESASNGDIVAGLRDDSDVDPAADTWAWQWDCLSAPPFTAISPNSSTSGSVPRNWTWIWNCGDNPVQYQSGTASQYQPVNMNVSIRISSPGNDGPVSQSNVAIAVSSGRTSPDGHTPAGPSPSPSPPVAPGASFPGIPSLPPIASLPGLSSLPAVLSPVVSVSPSLVEGGDVSGLVVGAALSFGDEPVELPFVSAGARGRRDAVAHRRRPDPRRRDRRCPDGAWASGTGSRLAPAIVGAAGRPSSIEAAATSSRRSDAQRRAKPAPRWRTPVPTSPAPAVGAHGRKRGCVDRRRVLRRRAPRLSRSSVPGRVARPGQARRTRTCGVAIRASQPHARYAGVALPPSR